MQRIDASYAAWLAQAHSASGHALIAALLTGSIIVTPATESPTAASLSWDRLERAEPIDAAENLRLLVAADAEAILESERIAGLAQATDATVRRAACRALAYLRDELRVPVLLETLSDSDPAVRREARRALTAISGSDRGEEIAAWRSWHEQHQQNSQKARALANRLIGGTSDHLNADLEALLACRSHRRIIVETLEELLLHPNRRVHLLAGKALQGVDGGMARYALDRAVDNGLLASAFRRPPPEPMALPLAKLPPSEGLAAAESRASGPSGGSLFLGGLLVALLALIAWPIISQYIRHHRSVTEHTRRFTRSVQRRDS